MLMERETKERSADGLAVLTKANGDGAANTTVTDAAELDHVKREAASDEEGAQEYRIVLNERDRSLSVDGSSETTQSKFALAEEPSLCIDESIHAECIDWILEVGVSCTVAVYRSQMHND